MKEMLNILGWLGKAEENTVMKDAVLHVSETCKTVAFLAEAVRAFIANDLAATAIAIEKVKQSERQADRLRSKMVAELTEDLIQPVDREDLLRFARALDKIADSTLRTGRILGFIEEKLPDAVLKNMAISTELIVKGMNQLQEAIRAFGKNQGKDTLACCDEVERCEHEADDQKRVMLDAVLHANLSAPSLLLCYNLAEALEAITDRIDTVSDMLKLFAVRSR
jgi:predicted phosphate transport protein (TIGR00153 family)